MEVQPTTVTRTLIFHLNSAKILSGGWRAPNVGETQSRATERLCSGQPLGRSSEIRDKQKNRPEGRPLHDERRVAHPEGMTGRMENVRTGGSVRKNAQVESGK